MSRIYVSGAISHHKLDERRKAFDECEELCRQCGWDEVVNPFKNILWRLGRGETADWREHMREDLKDLLSCDAILMMCGWEESKGCKLELDVASSCGLKVYYEGRRTVKAKEFIRDCTRKCSNELVAVEDRCGKTVVSYSEWVTPENALRAVEMARQEAVGALAKHEDQAGKQALNTIKKMLR